MIREVKDDVNVNSGGRPATGSSGKVVGFVKSLWSNPFRWQVIKSVGLFAVAVIVAREMANADDAVQSALKA